MNRTVAALLCLIAAGLMLNGCATLNGTTPFRYQPSMISGEPSRARLGVDVFADIRPSGDRSATKDITDVDEKVTEKVIEDLRSSDLFPSVSFPSRKDRDQIVVKGDIKRFYWKRVTCPIAYIPLLDLLTYLGIPIYRIEGIAELRLQWVSASTGKVLADYDKSAHRRVIASIYNMKAGEAGAELADAFRDVMKQVKEAAAADIRSGRLAD